MNLTVEALAQEIRRVDGKHTLGAGTLAEVLLPFIERHIAAGQQGAGNADAWMHEEDPTRVISAKTKAGALADAGASGSSVRPYSIPLLRLATPLSPKPAGAVPMPEAKHWICGCRMGPESDWPPAKLPSPKSFLGYSQDELTAYGDAREVAGRADAVSLSDNEWADVLDTMRLGADVLRNRSRPAMAEDLEAAINVLRKLHKAAPLPQQPAAEGENNPQNTSWQRQALLLMDDVDRLVRHCAVCADTVDFYQPCADAFWKVCHMIAGSEANPAAAPQQMTTQGEGKPVVNVGTIGHVSRDKGTLTAALTKIGQMTQAEGAGREAVAPERLAAFLLRKVQGFNAPGKINVERFPRDLEMACKCLGMLYTRPSPVADHVVKAIAAKCGVYYGDGKVNLGAPLYAFTPSELLAFSRRLQATNFTPQ